MPIPRLTVAIFALVISSFPLRAQAGGESELLGRIIGHTQYEGVGGSVAGAGDVDGDGVPDLIVGATGIGPNGSAFVYSGATGLTLHTFVGDAAGDGFGNTVDGAGDVDGDGLADLVVGASSAEIPGVDHCGAVYVFSGATGNRLHYFTGAANDHLGVKVFGLGDVDGDTYDDILVGSEYAYNGSISQAGYARVYSGGNASILHQIDGAYGQAFLGRRIADAGDVNNDGHADFIVGKPEETPGGIVDAGSAYVYSGSDGSVLHRFDGENFGDHHGSSVAAAGDVNNDGYSDLMVASPLADPGGVSDAGIVYVFSGHSGEILYRYDGTTSGWWNDKLASAGDVDDDGFDDFLMGSTTAHPCAAWSAGAAYLYSGGTGMLLASFCGYNRSDHLGSSLGSIGDMNLDGAADFFIGSSGFDAGGVADSGELKLYAFEAFLKSGSYIVSAAGGGTVALELDFPDLASGYEYKVLISTSGIGPTTYGVDIPLSLDSMVIGTFNGVYPISVSSGLHGILSAGGTANASMTIPSGLPPSMIGRTFWLAAIANPTGQLPHYSSVALPITIAP